MSDGFFLNESSFEEKLTELIDLVTDLAYESDALAKIENRDCAIGNAAPFLLLARQQDYLLSVSQLYKKHAETEVIDKLEVVKLRTQRTITEISNSITN